MQETCVQSLVWKGTLEKEMAMHYNILTWESPWKMEPGELQFMGFQKDQTQFNDLTARSQLCIKYHAAYLNYMFLYINY